MNYKDLLEKNNLKVNKYTFKGKVIIIDTPLGNFILKPNYNKNYNYNYLLSRGFNFLPEIIDYNDNYILYKYIEDISYDESQKCLDFIKILSILHNKTAHYKEVDYLYFKNIYENLNNRINDLIDYYNELANLIENNVYYSPSNYLIIRNISLVFSCLNFLKNELYSWYDLVKNNRKIRICSNYNNIDLSNLLKDKDSTYLLSTQYLKEDMPIYDLLLFYKKYCLSYDFSYLLNAYEKIFPLSIEEKKLLFIYISVPNKMVFTTNELQNVLYVRKEIDLLLNTSFVLSSKEKKQTDNNENKINK